MLELGRGLDAIGAAHIDIHQHQIDGVPPGLLQCLGRAARFGHHLELRHGFQPRAQAIAHQRMIVDQQDFDTCVHSSSI